jgi:putative ABC transport system substrate-binding protein
MRRRHFLGAALAVPAVARAQGRSGGKIGYVYVGPKELVPARVDTIAAGVRASGYTLASEDLMVRVTEGRADRLAPAVAEVLAQKVSVFIAGGPPSLRAAQQATRTVPIVAYDFETDPVAGKYAQSIARPGGNVTGVFLDLPAFAGKWLELLHECMPQLARVGVIWDPDTGRLQADAVIKASAGLGIKTDLLEVHATADYPAAFANAREHGAQAVILLSSPLVFIGVKEIGELSARQRMPTITMFAEFAKAGGLLGYGPSLLGAFRQASFMAGKILAGANVATTPIERPTTYELVVNQRSAEAMGVKIPASIQARADEVIE